MSTYRYNHWIQWDGVKFCSIEKKTFFGWKEYQWWHDTKEGRKSMKEAVENLRKNGHDVL